MEPGSDRIGIHELLGQSDWLRRLARRLAVDESVADEAVQETWLKAMQHPPQRHAAASSWLARVLRNVLVSCDRGERRRRGREQVVGPAAGPPSPQEILDREAVRHSVVQAVLDLEEPQREVVLLRYWSDLEPSAIAARLGIPASTVRNRLLRVREHLRERLDRDCGGRGSWMILLSALEAGGKSATLSVPALTGAAAMTMSAKVLWMGGAVIATTVIWTLAEVSSPVSRPPGIGQVQPVPTLPVEREGSRESHDSASTIPEVSPAASPPAERTLQPDPASETPAEASAATKDSGKADAAPSSVDALREQLHSVLLRLVDGAGEPLPGVAITLVPPDEFRSRESPRTEPTEEDGRAAFRGCGTEGYLAEFRQGSTRFQKNGIPRGKEVTLVLPSGREVGVHVLDADGEGLPGSTVTTLFADFRFPAAVSETDGTGSTAVPVPERTGIRLVATHDRQSTERALDPPIPELVELWMETGMFLTGTVTAPSGTPLSGISVSYRTLPPAVTTTDDAGRFGFWAAPPVDRVAFSREGAPDQMFSICFDEILARYGSLPGSLDAGVLVLAEDLALLVHVADPSGEPLKGAQVTVRGALFAGGALPQENGILEPVARPVSGNSTAWTEATGLATLLVREGLRYELEVACDGHARWQDAVQIERPRPEVWVLLDPPSSLIVHLDPERVGEKPSLFLTPAEPGPGRDRHKLRREGDLAVGEDLHAGRHLLTVQQRGASDQTLEITLLPGPNELELPARTTQRFHGVVYDVDGAPLARAYVMLVTDRQNAAGDFTDDQGVFELHGSGDLSHAFLTAHTADKPPRYCPPIWVSGAGRYTLRVSAEPVDWEAFWAAYPGR